MWAYSMRGAWYLIPFSLLWGGFAIFWEVSALASGAGPFFALWGVPFVAIGLYLIFGRIFVARREAYWTHHAVTNRRVVILAGAFSRRTIEMALTDLPPSRLEERASGLGTITFGAAIGGFRPPPGWPTMGGPPCNRSASGSPANVLTLRAPATGRPPAAVLRNHESPAGAASQSASPVSAPRPAG